VFKDKQVSVFWVKALLKQLKQKDGGLRKYRGVVKSPPSTTKTKGCLSSSVEGGEFGSSHFQGDVTGFDI